jgi:transcription antitermination factor NusG
MPLLEAEPNLYPANLFAEPPCSSDGDARWWVLYTQARAEKSLARQLFSRKVTFYLPLHRTTWISSNRKRTAYLPLFPGYVFLFGDSDARVAALETNLLSTTIPVGDQQRLRDDLIRVERFLGGKVPVLPERELPPGQPVVIESGPFKGIQGKVIRRGQQTRFVVEVEFLRQGVSVEVDGWAIRQLETCDK